MNWKLILTLGFGCTLSAISAESALAATKNSTKSISNPFLIADSQCRVSSNKPRSKKVDPDANLDGEKFVEVLRQKLPLDEHMGYVVIVQNSSLRNVATDTSGYAISNCDPDGPKPFTVDTRTAWGSVSKLITTAVVANLAQESNQVSLGDRIAPFIPNRWNLHPRFADVTFAQLLGHRAGLRKSAGTSLPERLAQTFSDDPAVGVRSYSNTGHGIAGRMIMRALSPSSIQTWENQNARTTQSEYNEAFIKWSSFFYLGYAGSQVLSPSNIDWKNDASCNINQFRQNGLPYARRYRSGVDPNGILLKDNSLTCFSGGWIMSARHMARFMRTLRHTNMIVNRQSYNNMTACKLGFDRGGDGYIPSPAFHKNGLITDSNGHRYSAYVVMLPGGYTAVAASNSGSSDSLQIAVRDAFNASYSPPAPSPRLVDRANLEGRCVYW